MSLPAVHDECDEQQPLLGAQGASLQSTDAPLWRNLISGTAPIAQVGGVVLAVAVFGAVLSHPLMLFSAHPVRPTSLSGFHTSAKRR
jgi:hypothetical protein